VSLTRALEKGDGENYVELVGELLHVPDGRVTLEGRGEVECALVLGLREILSFEELGREHDLGALARSFANEGAHARDVVVAACREGALNDGN
jgi:hypothetical protein